MDSEHEAVRAASSAYQMLRARLEKYAPGSPAFTDWGEASWGAWRAISPDLPQHLEMMTRPLPKVQRDTPQEPAAHRRRTADMGTPTDTDISGDRSADQEPPAAETSPRDHPDGDSALPEPGPHQGDDEMKDTPSAPEVAVSTAQPETLASEQAEKAEQQTPPVNKADEDGEPMLAQANTGTMMVDPEAGDGDGEWHKSTSRWKKPLPSDSEMGSHGGSDAGPSVPAMEQHRPDWSDDASGPEQRADDTAAIGEAKPSGLAGGDESALEGLPEATRVAMKNYKKQHPDATRYQTHVAVCHVESAMARLKQVRLPNPDGDVTAAIDIEWRKLSGPLTPITSNPVDPLLSGFDLIRVLGPSYAKARSYGCNYYDEALTTHFSFEDILKQGAPIIRTVGGTGAMARKELTEAVEIGMTVVTAKPEVQMTWIPIDPMVDAASFFTLAPVNDRSSFSFTSRFVHRLPYEPNFVGAHNVFSAWRAVAVWLARHEVTRLWLKGSESEMELVRAWLLFVNSFDDGMVEYLKKLKYVASGPVLMQTPEHIAPDDKALCHIIDSVMLETNRGLWPTDESRDRLTEPYEQFCHIHPGQLTPGSKEWKEAKAARRRPYPPEPKSREEMRARCLHCPVVESILHALYNLPDTVPTEKDITEIQFTYSPTVFDVTLKQSALGWLKKKDEPSQDVDKYPVYEATAQKMAFGRYFNEDWPNDLNPEEIAHLQEVRSHRRALFEDLYYKYLQYKDQLWHPERLDRLRADFAKSIDEPFFRELRENARLRFQQSADERKRNWEEAGADPRAYERYSRK